MKTFIFIGPILTALLAGVCLSFAQTCPDNYSYFSNGKCYRLFTTPVKLAAARFTCYNDGAYLPTIHNPLDDQVLTNVTLALGVQTWLGLYCTNAVSCAWDDGSAFDYGNFVGGQPNTNYGNCAFLLLSQAERGFWQSTDCNYDLRASVCQKDPVTVPTGCAAPFSQQADGRCYYVQKNAASYTAAEADCKQKYADVVSIENGLQNSVIQALANQSQLLNIYIGLNLVGQNSYVWSDPKAIYNYTNWQAGYPTLNSGACTIMAIGGPTNGQWRTIDCSYSLPYICSYGDFNTPQTTTSCYPHCGGTTLPPSNVCPQNPYYGNEGQISSPNYPNYYGGSTECSYLLYVPAGDFVAVKFSDFDLKTGDYLDLYDGDNLLIARLQSPIDISKFYITKISNQMKLEFVSNFGNSFNRGWSLYFEPTSSGSVPTQFPSTTLSPFTSSPPTVCPATVYYTTGTIASPGYPGYYGNNLNCTYVLNSSQSKIQITFISISLAQYDSIFLYDGNNENSALINILSGKYDPNSQIFHSTGQFMTIKFQSDSVATSTGFLATFVSFSGNVSPPPSITTTNPSTRLCQDGWIHDIHEMYCYKFFPNGGPWAQNLQTCGQSGSQLLTVHDALQENDVLNFVQSSLGSTQNHVWIGLRKNFGDWEWSDGTQYTYSGFLPGQPDPSFNCAAIQSYTNPAGWVALDCNTVLPFVCYHYSLSK